MFYCGRMFRCNEKRKRLELKQMTRFRCKWIYGILMVLLCLGVLIQPEYTKAAAKVKIKYDNKWHTYKDVQPTLYVDNTKIKCNAVPMLRLDKTIMAPVDKLMKGMGAKYTYKNNVLTIEWGTETLGVTNTLVLEAGSKTAVLNGNKEYTMKTYPRVVRYKKTKKKILMVPVSFVVKKMGYSYKYSSVTKTVRVHSLVYSQVEVEPDTTVDPAIYLQNVYKCKATYDDKTGDEHFTISGTNAEVMAVSSANIDATNRTVTMQFPQTYNALGALEVEVKKSSFMESYSVTQITEDTVEVVLKYKIGSQVYVSTTDTEMTVNMTKLKYALIIPKAEDVNFEKITDTDNYLKQRFSITIKGDYTEYFNENPIQILSTKIKSVSVTLTSAGNTKITVKTSKIQGYKYYDQGDTICVDVRNPSEIYSKIVVLDPGHGGKDPGAVSRGTNEKDLNYKVLYTYGKKYFDKSDIKVYYTRTKDTYVPLYTLAAFSAKVEADMYISLHMNSSLSSAANGTEVYYSTINKNKWKSGLNSRIMAKKFQSKVRKAMGTANRGVHTANFVVVKANSVPAVLIELGFMTSSRDYKKITSSKYQKKAAKAIYQSVNSLFNKYDTDRNAN